MNVYDWLIIAAVVCAAALAAIKIIRDKKRGRGCCGSSCSGCCACCGARKEGEADGGKASDK